MNQNVVPMIHVPDVRATVDWYESIGFKTVAKYGNETGDGLGFAIVSFGTGQVMFSQDGETSTKRRREVDLYVYTDDVDATYQRLKDRVKVIDTPHDRFYGMREIIIRDLNGFWVTFGQESVFSLLMDGVNEGKPESVRRAVESGQLAIETINVAFAFALTKENKEIVEMLRQAGPVPPPQIELATLQSYVGNYECEHGPPVEISLKDGGLFAAPGAQHPVSLWPLDQVTFKPIAFDDAKVIFNADGLTFIQEDHKNEYRRR